MKNGKNTLKEELKVIKIHAIYEHHQAKTYMDERRGMQQSKMNPV